MRTLTADWEMWICSAAALKLLVSATARKVATCFRFRFWTMQQRLAPRYGGLKLVLVPFRFDVERDKESGHHVVGGDYGDELDHVLRTTQSLEGLGEGLFLHGYRARHLEAHGQRGALGVVEEFHITC